MKFLIDEKDKQKIIQLYNDGTQYREIHKILNLDYHKVRRFVISLSVKGNTSFSEYEDNFIKEFYPLEGGPFCAQKLGRNLTEVQVRARNLSIKRRRKRSDIRELDQNLGWCSTCQEYKPISEISTNKNKRTGKLIKFNKCVKCHSNYKQQKRNERGIDYWARVALQNYKKTAKKKNFDFDLDKEWIISNIKDRCPALGIKLELPDGSRNYSVANSISVDRIDNKIGYTKDNCVIVSRRANLMKNDGTLNEMIKITDFYKQLWEEKNLDYSI